MTRVLSVLFWLFALTLTAVITVVYTVLDDTPMIATAPPPTPEDVAATRSFVRAVRLAADEGGSAPPVIVTESDANGILRVAGRMFPQVRARANVLESRVSATASVEIPWITGTRWLNVEGLAPEFEGRPRLDYLRVGGLEVPPAPVIWIGRVAANLVMGNQAGDVFLESARRMQIEDETMTFELSLSEADKKGFMQGLFGAMRGADMPSAAEVDGYYVEIRRALDGGRLPDTGSYLPHLRFVLQRVLERSADETLENEYTAGIFGLAKACGAKDFTLVVGRLVGDPLDAFGDWRTDCSAVEFAGRVDTRRHFTTAAAIQAASNRGVSSSIGEFKELYDSRGWESGGFDFTDIAANQSGIRLSNLVMSGTRADLERTIALMEREGDVLVPYTGIPQIMLRAEFEERFGSIESAEYADMIEQIERRIDAVTIHLPRQ